MFKWLIQDFGWFYRPLNIKVGMKKLSRDDLNSIFGIRLAIDVNPTLNIFMINDDFANSRIINSKFSN